MAEAEAGRRGGQHGSLCQHLPGGGSPAPPGLGPQDGWRHPIPEEGVGQALWRMSRRNRMKAVETCCWRRSGRSWSCISGQSCWSSHCPGPGPGPCLCLGPYRGCSAACRRHRGGCVSGGGCGASGGRGHLSGSLGCPAGTPARRGGPSGDGSGGSGT